MVSYKKLYIKGIYEQNELITRAHIAEQKLEKIKEIMNTTVFGHQMYDEIREIIESEY